MLVCLFDCLFEFIDMLFSRFQNFGKLELLVTLGLREKVLDIFDVADVSTQSFLGVLDMLSQLADVGSN